MPTNLENGYYIASILAGVASIISGIFSWRKALRAKSSADEAKIFAEKVKDLFKNRRDLSEASELYTATKSIHNTISKFGACATEETIKGLSTAEIATEIGAYISLVNENKDLFDPNENNPASELYEEVKRHISVFAEAKTPKTALETGRNIYWAVDSFKATTKSLKNKKNDSII